MDSAASTEQKPPKSIGELVDRFGGNTKFGAVIGKAPSTASEMKRRGSIPVEYWPAIIAAAQQHGIEGLTSDAMMQLHLADAAAEPISEGEAA